MKNLLVLLITVFCLSLIASCGRPYKKRKGCKGTGGWYGNRNLSQKVQQPTIQDLYVWMPASEEAEQF